MLIIIDFIQLGDNGEPTVDADIRAQIDAAHGRVIENYSHRPDPYQFGNIFDSYVVGFPTESDALDFLERSYPDLTHADRLAIIEAGDTFAFA